MVVVEDGEWRWITIGLSRVGVMIWDEGDYGGF